MNTATAENKIMYITPAHNFSKIPGSPIAYWVGAKLSSIFSNAQSLSEIGDVRIGMGTGNNALFLREWWEVNITKIDFNVNDVNEVQFSNGKYFPYVKGGDCRRWYGNQQKVVWYDIEGQIAMKNTSGHRENGGHDRYFQPSITWSYINSAAFNARYMPAGFVFDVNGSSIFLNNGEHNYILSFMLSCVCRLIVNVLNPTLSVQAGNIRNLPIFYGNTELINSIATVCLEIEKTDWDSFETSWDFKKHPLI